jgi:hypothetical protein
VDSPNEDLLRGLVDDYRAAWNRGEAEAIAAFYHSPNLTLLDGELHVDLDEESARQAIVRWLEVHREAGPATWEIASFAHTPLGANSALVTCHWVYRRPDGSVVWEYPHSALWCLLDGRWRVLASVYHD